MSNEPNTRRRILNHAKNDEDSAAKEAKRRKEKEIEPDENTKGM
jgi:hypothetical protein